MSILKRHISALFLLFFVALVAGCGGGESSGLPSQIGEHQTPSGLVVTPSEPSVAAGTELQLKVEFTDEEGTTEDATEKAQYFSDDQAVVKVDKTGKLLGVTEGSALVTVLYQGEQEDITVEVLPPEYSELQIIPQVATSAIGLEKEFEARAIYTDGSFKIVTSEAVWESDDGAIASIESPGIAKSLDVGKVNISATWQQKSTIATLSVTDATIASIVVSPKVLDLPNGLTEQLTAVAQLSDGTTQDISNQVDWESDNSAVATVDDRGLVTSVADSGDATITATATVGSDTFTDTAEVSASAATATTLTISPINPSLPVGVTQQFKVDAVFSDGSEKDVTDDVTWVSSAAVVTINDTGLAMANSVGEATITAELDEQVSTTKITVTDAVITNVTVTTEPDPVSLAKGQKAKVTVLANYGDGSQHDVTELATLISQDVAVAAIVEGNAIYAVDVGSTTVTARFNSHSSAPVNVDVTDATVSSITVSPDSLTLPNGTTGELAASANFDGLPSQDVTSQVSWTTGSSLVASVNADGLVTANSVGTTTVKASFNGVDSPDIIITVTSATIIDNGLTVEPENLDLAKGDTGNVTSEAEFSDGSTLLVTNLTTWTTSDSSIVTVTSSGEVQAIEEGTATVTGSYQGESATATVNVGPVRLDRLRLRAVDNSLNILGLIRLTLTQGDELFRILATAYYSDGTDRELDANEVIYSSSNNELVDIDANVISLANADVIGSATITGEHQSIMSENRIDADCLTQVTLLGLIGLGLACDIDDTQPNPDYVAP